MVVIEAQLGLDWDQFVLGSPSFSLLWINIQLSSAMGTINFHRQQEENTGRVLPQLRRAALVEGETEAQSKPASPGEHTQSLAGVTISTGMLQDL